MSIFTYKYYFDPLIIKHNFLRTTMEWNSSLSQNLNNIKIFLYFLLKENNGSLVNEQKNGYLVNDICMVEDNVTKLGTSQALYQEIENNLLQENWFIKILIVPNWLMVIGKDFCPIVCLIFIVLDWEETEVIFWSTLSQRKQWVLLDLYISKTSLEIPWL